MVNQCTKFEVSRFTRYEAMNGGANCRKWKTMYLSFTVFEVWPVICRKSPILTTPPAFAAPQRVIQVEFRGGLCHQKTRVSIVWCLCDPTFSRFSRTPNCDRQTDGQTQGHTIYSACIAFASPGNSCSNSVLRHRRARLFTVWWRHFL